MPYCLTTHSNTTTDRRSSCPLTAWIVAWTFESAVKTGEAGNLVHQRHLPFQWVAAVKSSRHSPKSTMNGDIDWCWSHPAAMAPNIWTLGNGAVMSIHQPKAALLMDSVPPVMWNPFPWIQHELTPRTPPWNPKEPPFSPLNFIGVMDSPCSDTWTHLAVQVAPVAFAKRRMMPRVFTTCKAASTEFLCLTWRVSCSTSPNLRFQIRKLQKKNVTSLVPSRPLAEKAFFGCVLIQLHKNPSNWLLQNKWRMEIRLD